MMGAESVSDPGSARLLEEIPAAVTSGDVVVLCADCEVEYDGRAAGYLGPGERLVICKPDGTLLIHRPSGHDPVNWQPPGSTITVESRDDTVVVTARRTEPDEVIHVYLLAVFELTRFSADDSAPLELEGTEADMHEYVDEHPEEIEDGLRIIEHERETPYGSIDFLGTDSDGRPVVMEVKRRQATLTHVDQLRRYLARYRETNPDARGMLIAPAASEKVLRTLRDAELEFVELDAFAKAGTDHASTTLTHFQED